MNRSVSNGPAAGREAHRLSCHVVGLGTPFGPWDRDLVPALHARMPALVSGVSSQLTQLLDRAVGQVDLLAVDQSGWTIDTDAVARVLGGQTASPVAAWSADARACWALPLLADQDPTPRFVAFVDSPVDALAACVDAGSDLHPRLFLDRWCDGAEHLLRLLDLPDDRRLLVDAGQARRHPQAFAREVARFVGLPATGDATAPAVRLQPLSLAVARSVAERHGRCVELHLRLLAACTVLEDEPAEWLAAVSPAQQALDNGMEIGVLRELAARAAERDTLAAGLAQAQSRLLEAERVAAASADAVALQRQAEQAAAALERDNALLEAHSRQVVEELLHLQARLDRGLPGPGGRESSASDAQAVVCRYGAVAVSPPRETPPHRELGLQFSKVVWGDKVLATLDVRLVEHHGRPGLVLFGDAGQGPLSGWMESGTEEGRGYMLLIPSDVGTGAPWPRLTGEDLLRVARLAETVAAVVSARVAVAPMWNRVATRFIQEWASLPEMLRFEGVSAEPAGQDDAVDISFQAASMGSRALGTLVLRWGGAGNDQWLLLRGTGDPGRQWASWPVEPDGRLSVQWRLPVGTWQSSAQQRADWAAMTPQDRATLLAVFDTMSALPTDPRAEGARAQLASVGAERLAAARRQATQAAAAPWIRRVARALRAVR